MYCRAAKLTVVLLGFAAMELIFTMYFNSCQRKLYKVTSRGTVPTKSQFAVKGINCTAIAENNSSEISRALDLSALYNDLNKVELRSYLASWTESCYNFLASRGYVTSSLTDEERDFPIAFGILIYTELDRFERLLRAIYRPQNFYCVHEDAESGDDFQESLRTLLTCFPNVFLSSRSVAVRWGSFSVLEADLICMKDLLRFKWKYFINLTGQEFPLKTNRELVKILTAYKGANDIRGSTGK